MITLYGRKNSSNVQRVIWTLEEIGVDYRRVTVGGSFGGTDEPSYRAMNPAGLVPTLRDGDLVVWESAAIMLYLAARFGAGGLWPTDPAARAKADQWLIWCETTLRPAFGDVFYRTARAPRASQDRAALAPFEATLVETLRVLDRDLEDGRPFLGGAAFTYGDIPIGILTYRAYETLSATPDLPRLSAWYERLQARPAFRTHVMTPLGSCAEEWLENERALHADEGA